MVRSEFTSIVIIKNSKGESISDYDSSVIYRQNVDCGNSFCIHKLKASKLKDSGIAKAYNRCP